MLASTTSSDLLMSVDHLDIEFIQKDFSKNSFRDYFTQLLSPQKSHQKITLLEDISLNVYKRDKIGILGVNGTGKTTLCRMMAGMCGPIKEISTYGKVRAFFEAGRPLMPELTGHENASLLSGLLFPELSSHEKKEYLKEVIEFSELGAHIHQSVKNYSKGMVVRLFLSLISGRPSDILILDEVFDGADMFFNQKMATRFMNTINNSGALIFISHSTEQIELICNRVLVIKDGRIIHDGPVDKGIEIYRMKCHDQRPPQIH